MEKTFYLVKFRSIYNALFKFLYWLQKSVIKDNVFKEQIENVLDFSAYTFVHSLININFNFALITISKALISEICWDLIFALLAIFTFKMLSTPCFEYYFGMRIHNCFEKKNIIGEISKKFQIKYSRTQTEIKIKKRCMCCPPATKGWTYGWSRNNRTNLLKLARPKSNF